MSDAQLIERLCQLAALKTARYAATPESLSQIETRIDEMQGEISLLEAAIRKRDALDEIEALAYDLLGPPAGRDTAAPAPSARRFAWPLLIMPPVRGE
jgi:hypothetical protein